ncbi:hypothetical protein [Nocardia farcinica]|uniref:hypothetical protein n=1 Tax=Nocardia farcinica TaxID=37329 RepID=UPI002458BD2A|nr:hypothetical protein [Nocardia farcinica]
MDDQVAALAQLIDPEVWAAAEADQTTIGSQWDMRNRRRLSQERARHIISSGCAVVKLPDMVVDEDGFKTWPVDSNGRDAHVWRKLSDRTVSLSGVSTSGMDRAQVWSLAAALLAAHRYVGEEATDAA